MSADFTLAGADTAVAEEPADPTAAALIEFLRAEGGVRLRHGEGRVLLDHLVGTYNVTRRWGQPVWLQHAALLHSVYGTEAYGQQLVSLSRREEVQGLAGAQAERLAYLFSVTPRKPLLSGTHTWMRLPSPGDDAPPTRAELDALVLLHMANLADQAQSRDGSPVSWLVRLRDIAESLLDSDTIRLPIFISELASFAEEDEQLARRTYLTGLKSGADTQARENTMGLAAAVCPVLAEPCIWLAHFAQRRNDLSGARAWAGVGRRRLGALGTAWDKRLRFDEWLALSMALTEPDDLDRAPDTNAINDPRWLYEETLGRPRSRARVMPEHQPVDRAEQRFLRYVESLGDGGPAVFGRRYPDLESRPWFDAQEFPLATYLEENFGAIRKEILALHPSRFHPESEGIGRSGDWDVLFFYERGRRHNDVCRACPVTARGLDSYPAMRTITGLIYVSRMRAGTHIAPHRGPTNLRLRCHLGIEVPSGDCAIRVDDETRHWVQGKCLVFDDFFEHEAWNHTDEDRVVLIVDLWHPGLSAVETRLLEGLHGYAYAHAHKLRAYWGANAAAARTSAED